MAELTREEIGKIVDAELERRRETQGLPHKWKIESLGWMAAIILGVLAIAGFAFDDWIAGKVESFVTTAVTQNDQKGFGVLRDAVSEKLSQSNGFQSDVARRTLPKGAVVIVNDKNGCPANWSVDEMISGRFVVGVGGQPGLIAKAFHKTGGAEVHELTKEELPNTQVPIRFENAPHHIGFNDQRKPGYALKFERRNDNAQDNGQSMGTGRSEFVTDPLGEGKAHNNMPPYIALYFCKKEAG